MDVIRKGAMIKCVIRRKVTTTDVIRTGATIVLRRKATTVTIIRKATTADVIKTEAMIVTVRRTGENTNSS